jgi:putative surface protein
MFDFAKRKICANQLTSMMKGIAALAPTLLLTLMFTSCMSDGYTDTAAGKSDTYINLNVSTPTAQARANAPAGSTTGTSGSPGQDETSPKPTEEEKIYSIRVWAFKSGPDENAMPIGFKAVTGLNKTGSYNVSMKLLRKAAGNLENIDLYILLNAESIDVLDGNNCNTMTRKALKDATFNSNFGINPNGSPQAPTVPAKGLPISRVITNINVKDNIADNAAAAAANPVSVPLVRAVSKLHFFFARKTGKDTESVTVTKIEVNGETLTAASPVFPEAATDAEKDNKGLTGSFTGLTYLNGQILKFGEIATSEIKDVNDPKDYIRKDGEKAQEYMTRLSTGGVQEGCRSYLRETNEAITGKIYFKSNASLAERWVEFKIPKAYRNHELVVYGYFSGEAFLDLNLQYYVANWNEKGATNIEFN